MNIMLSTFVSVVQDSLIKIIVIILATMSVCFFYANTKAEPARYEASALFELGSLNQTSIDSAEVLRAIADANNYDNITVVKGYSNHSHYLILSNISLNKEKTSTDLKNFMNLILERQNLMYSKRFKVLQESIDLIDEELKVSTSDYSEHLLLILIEKKEMINTFTKSRIISDLKITTMPKKNYLTLGLINGLILGLLLSAFFIGVKLIFIPYKK